MTSLLLAVIYLAFIGLGLPDSLLGAAWPSMYGELGVPLSAAGSISIIIAGGTIVSSLLSDRMLRRFGTGPVTVVSVGLTAVALLGFSCTSAFWQACLWGVPYGLGAGSVDAALNNFVALHYRSRHMSWLHCFWGIGATAGPYVMGLCLTNGLSWNGGYRVIGLAQAGLVGCLVLSLPLWRRTRSEQARAVPQAPLTLRQALALPDAKCILTAFFCYCALETTTGLWASSYLVLAHGLTAEKAASWAGLFYLGITVGRLISGFVSDRLGDVRMVRIGQIVVCAGLTLLALPLGGGFALAGLVCVGLGCAPIYPCLLHETPAHFGAGQSQALMGMQMACAYLGNTLMPPVFGFLAQQVSARLYPFYLLAFAVVMLYMSERMNRRGLPAA